MRNPALGLAYMPTGTSATTFTLLDFGENNSFECSTDKDAKSPGDVTKQRVTATANESANRIRPIAMITR